MGSDQPQTAADTMYPCLGCGERWFESPGRYCQACALEHSGARETTQQLHRDFVRERWVGEIQLFLEQMIEAAPDETCRVFARNLWDETAEFPDD